MLVEYENPLFEAAPRPQKTAYRPSSGTYSFPGDSANIHESSKNVSSCRSLCQSSTGSYEVSSKPAAEQHERTTAKPKVPKAVAAANTSSIRSSRTAKSSAAGSEAASLPSHPPKQPKKGVDRQRRADKSLWGRLTGLRFCATPNTVLDTIDDLSVADAKEADLQPKEPQQKNKGDIPANEPAAVSTKLRKEPADTRLAEHMKALKAGEDAILPHQPATNQLQHPMKHAPKKSCSTLEDWRVPQEEALHKTAEEWGIEISRQHEHPRKSPRSHWASSSVRRRSLKSQAIDESGPPSLSHQALVSPIAPRSRAHSSRMNSWASSNARARSKSTAHINQGVTRNVLSSRASISELLENWRATHSENAPPAHEKPFIDPDEYGGHVNLSRARWNPTVNTDVTTITTILQSKLQVRQQERYKRRSSEPLPKRKVQVLPGMDPLNVPNKQLRELKAHKWPALPASSLQPRCWGEENFAEAIGVQRRDKQTGLSLPKSDEWIDAHEQSPKNCIPLEKALGLDESCVVSDDEVSSRAHDLLAEAIAEAKVANYLNSLPSLTLDSGSLFITAVEKTHVE